MPGPVAALDLQLLTVRTPRNVRRDGIHLPGLRYFATTAAPYVGEAVTIRYDPPHLAEIRVHHHDQFLGRAVAPGIAAGTISASDHRNKRTHQEPVMTHTRPPQPTRTRTLITASAVALLCTGLAACSSGGPKIATPTNAADTSGAAASSELASSVASPAASGLAVDPCTLLTPAEAASLLGGPAQHKPDPPKVVVQGNGLDVTGHTCAFSLVTSDQLGHEIRIEVETGATRSYFDQEIHSGDGAAISGLGDAAYGSSIDVKVFSKNTMLQVYGSLAAADGLQQVARDAIAKL